MAKLSEPLVPEDSLQALELASASKIPLIKRYIVRRAASENELLNNLVAHLAVENDLENQALILEEMLAAFEGRVGIPMPTSWTATASRSAR